MMKFILPAVLAAFLIGAFFAPIAWAGPSTDVASAAPGNANAPVTSKNMPAYLDEDLASKHANFSKFARIRVNSLNLNHGMSKTRMQIVKQADGTYKARYHVIDSNTVVPKVRRSSSKSVPYVAVLKFQEVIMEAVGESPEACRKGTFSPVQIIPNRQIFSYKKGSWK
ncbi:hypothetical protein [Pseudodesulfovibrio sediminis]|uniref:Uncharacterized protein n=1 Tax=Pseudodesulfovibrio sediminis TaxID=2810563 RepID=A0ABN6ETD4_9BACT|nr:hypothetical protein [Pseudodesulfovibrio sediminis]BCS88495.1 hypothetical protein PSDVSF_17370 [Pseudodesulfovibrio sediminis]